MRRGGASTAAAAEDCRKSGRKTTVMRFFNTAGPIVAEDHYHVPPLERLDRDDLLTLIRRKRYFVLHAPRQTGKTSVLLALRDLLNDGAAGACRAAYVNVETGQSAREDVAAALRAVLSASASGARDARDDTFPDEAWPGILDRVGPHDALRETLSRWAESAARPLVLLIDEIDALVGDTLLAVLRQLRAGYAQRPRRFPQSVVLCGVRDVRDYQIRSSAENAIVAGGSAFNVRAKSLRLADFSQGEVESLLAQHTAETARRCTAASTKRFARDCGRRAPTWTAAQRRKDTWWSSIAAKARRGTTRCTAARTRPAGRRSRYGRCSSGAQGADDFSRFGEPLLGVLGEDRPAVGDDVEDPVVARDQLGVDAERVLDFGRQTGGPRQVLSADAVGDG